CAPPGVQPGCPVLLVFPSVLTPIPPAVAVRVWLFDVAVRAPPVRLPAVAGLVRSSVVLPMLAPSVNGPAVDVRLTVCAVAAVLKIGRASCRDRVATLEVVLRAAGAPGVVDARLPAVIVFSAIPTPHTPALPVCIWV